MASETRNQIYEYLVPVGTRFVVAQRMKDIEDEIEPRYARKGKPKMLTVDWVNGVKPGMGLLRTCKLIHYEAAEIMRSQIKGTFEVWIALDFKVIPKVLLNKIDTVVMKRPIKDSLKSRYVLNFPNVEVLLVGKLVEKLPYDTFMYNPDQCVQSFRYVYIEGYFTVNSIMRHDYFMSCVPAVWTNDIKNGKSKVKIQSHHYVLKDSDIAPGEFCAGALLVLDYASNKVVEWTATRFRRMLPTEIPRGLETNRFAHGPTHFNQYSISPAWEPLDV